MPLIAELTLRDPILFGPTFEAVPDAICTCADFHYVKHDAHHGYVFFWWLRGTQADAFEAAIDADDTIDDWTQIAALDERLLYRIESTSVPLDQPLVFPTFRDLNITVLEATYTLAGLELRIRVPNRESLRTFIDITDDCAREASVHRLYEETTDVKPLGALTQRQREVLETAYAAGYFASPRQATLEDLATELDVTTQTVSRHLRLAVETVLECMIGRTHNLSNTAKRST